MTTWLMLTATLPTTQSALRVRIWRMLKTTYCASLRDGVYLLPASADCAKTFWEMDAAIREAGADSYLLELQARDAAQEERFRALFDRSDLHVEFAQALKDARKSFQVATEAEIRRLLQTLDAQLQSIVRTDFFQSPEAASSTSDLRAFREEVERRLSPGEPASGELLRLEIGDHQRRTWATRTRPWVDRLATAWLVQRFVDAQPTFIWLSDTQTCPQDAVGYDYDGATFTQVGEHVSFEVVAASFAIDTDPGLARFGGLGALP